MAAAVVRVKDTRAMLKALGSPPTTADVEKAQVALKVIDEHLTCQLQTLNGVPPPLFPHIFSHDDGQQPNGRQLQQGQDQQADKESELRRAAEEEKLPYLSVLRLNELHKTYEGMLKSAENMGLIGGSGDAAASVPGSPMRPLYIKDEVNAEIAQMLQEAYEKHLETLNLSSRSLDQLPESFGKISSLVLLNLSNNRLKVLPNSMFVLRNLVNLDLSSNHLSALSEAFGGLTNLRILNVSGNQLRHLPESLSRCTGLVELNASFNQLEFLGPNVVSELVNLERLSLQLNRIAALPSSIAQLKSLKHLELQFNKLLSLPPTIGSLSSLETLDISSNFSNLVSLPDSIGDLESLALLDVSYNQLKELPLSVGKLKNLKKLKLDGNPLVLPPAEVIEHSQEAVMKYMVEQWKSNGLVMSKTENESGNTNTMKINSRKLSCSTLNNSCSGRPDSPSCHPNSILRASGAWISWWLHGMCSGRSFIFKGSKGKLMDWQLHTSQDDDYL